jgi:ketosteroid isomerase-like protein
MNVLRPAILLLLLACHPRSPEARVKLAFETCVKGVEAGDAGAVIENLDVRFTGPEGMDRNAAKLYLLGLLRREKIGVTVFSTQVEVKGREALQTVELLLTSRGGGLLPQDASRRSFLLRWVEADGKWRLRELVDATVGGANGPAPLP